ncbi:hypothetical protein L2E82_13176 [Cichorium intybus]|uniref:Uncharacterized protein n=1 Tax=Cichorium intybus TaxID=13427 RepID=A0ACB9GHK2_CICIN|nr:hypothetical protein L2E82_13176 [Cichorium intybus]
MAFEQSNESPTKSCCEKVHEAIFGKPNRTSNKNDVLEASLSTNNYPTAQPHVSREVKISQHLGHSSSKNVEDNDTVSGFISRPKLKLIARPRVDIGVKNIKS